MRVGWEWTDAQSDALFDDGTDLTGRVQILWHSDYYDGPLTGVATLDGAQWYWFHCVEDDWKPCKNKADDSCVSDCEEYQGAGMCCYGDRKSLFVVAKMDDEQISVERDNHDLFRKWVGHHTDYGPACGQVKQRGSMGNFYNADKPVAPPLRREQVVGYTLSLSIAGGEE